MALYRYRLIAPYAFGEIPKGEIRRSQEQLASHTGSGLLTPRPSTLRTWIAAYRRLGFDGLVPQVRSDKGQPRGFDPKVYERAVELRLEAPWRSVGQILRIISCQAEFNGLVLPKEDTLRAYLRSLQLSSRQLPHPSSRRYRRFQKDHVNQMWQGDGADGPYLPYPGKTARKLATTLFAFLDDHSRRIVHAEYYFDEKLPRLEDCFKKAILRCGIL